MIHPDTEIKYINKEKGYGVVATKLIPKGTITWVQDDLDQVYTVLQSKHLRNSSQIILDTYSFRNKNGEKILCWDNGKYVNHSFNPTCFTTPFDFEIATSDIQIGEELTCDYGYLNIEEPFTPLDEGCERKVVYPDDLITFHKQWDSMLAKLVTFSLEVPQPLQSYIAPEVWEPFFEGIKNNRSLPSLLSLHFGQ